MILLQLSYLLQEQEEQIPEADYWTGDTVPPLALRLMLMVIAIFIVIFIKMCYTIFLQNPVNKNKKLKCYNHEADEYYNKWLKSKK